MLAQLIYTSRLIFDASTPEGWERIEDIVSKGRLRNTLAQITSFVIVGDDWISQVLEGPRDAVMHTFSRILADPRHSDIMVVDIRFSGKRGLAGCSLGVSKRPRAAMPFDAYRRPNGLQEPLTFDMILDHAQIEAA